MQGFINETLGAWASFYANHALTRTAVEFFHVGGLVGGGGCAIAADRMILLARHQEPAERFLRLRDLSRTHRIVTTGIMLVLLSGLLLLAADTDTYLHSKVFWIKMFLFLLLLVNGVFLTRAEKIAQHSAHGWNRLVSGSIVSVALWMVTTLAGIALLNAG